MPKTALGPLFLVSNDSKEWLRPIYERDTFALRSTTPDDSGFITSYDLSHLTGPQRETSIGVVKVIRLDMKEDEAPLEGSFSSLPLTFASLGQSYGYYENIKRLAPDLQVQVLTALRDLAYFPSRSRQFRQQPAFQNSLIADARAMRALEDAPALFGKRFGRAGLKDRSHISRKWIVEGSSPSGVFRLDLDFTSLFDEVPTRIVALVGSNGTGKSAILSALAARVLGESSRDDPIQVERVRAVDRKRLDVARVISIAYGAFDQTPLLESTSDLVSRDTTVRHIYRGLRKSAGRKTTALKSNVQIEAELWDAMMAIRDIRRRALFRDVLERIGAVSHLPLEITKNLTSSRPRKASLRELSSGQLISLNVAVSLIAHLEPGSLVLIDEPEVHLHPPMVSAMIRSIAAALKEFDSFAVIATHSSIVVQELPRRNVIVLRRLDQIVLAERAQIQTYGESLGVIDRHVFGLAGVEADYEAVIREISKSGLDSEAARALDGLSEQARALAYATKVFSGEDL